MANIELRKRFFGEGIVGTVDLSSGPTLSWSEHNALLASSASLQLMRQTLEGLGLDIRSVALAVDELEARLGLKLDQQSMILDRQVHLLADIAESLRTPARVRAAERLSSVGELLRRKRYERALAAVEEAIEDDPNNPAGFIAAGWAQIGLERLDDARSMFIEAAQANDGDERSATIRQAARLTLALDGPLAALARLDEHRDDPRGPRERAAISYDRSVYLAEAGDVTASIASLLHAGRDEPSFLFAALADPLLASHPPVADAVSLELETRRHALRAQRTRYDELLTQLTTLIEELAEEDNLLRSAGKDERRTFQAELAAKREHYLKERPQLLEQSERTLQVERLTSAADELGAALDYAAAQRIEVFGGALQAVRLEQVVLDFATREAAWPIKLKDGTWEITRKRRFGHEAKWRATTADAGQPVIDRVE
jgi:tetratricopeptide (TPR) repeat protein